MNALVDFKEKRKRCPARFVDECTAVVTGIYYDHDGDLTLVHPDCKSNVCPFMYWLNLIDKK